MLIIITKIVNALVLAIKNNNHNASTRKRYNARNRNSESNIASKIISINNTNRIINNYTNSYSNSNSTCNRNRNNNRHTHSHSHNKCTSNTNNSTSNSNILVYLPNLGGLLKPASTRPRPHADGQACGVVRNSPLW